MSTIQIDIPNSIYTDKSIKSFIQLYTVLNLDKYINNILSTTNEKTFVLSNVKCNERTIDRILKHIQNNLNKNIDEETAMDFLNYSPTVDNSQPLDVIVLLTPDHKNYIINSEQK